MRNLAFQILSPRSFLALALVAASLAASGTSAQTPEGSDKPSPRLNALPQMSKTMQIGPGDLIDVEVFNTPELSGKHQVSQSGKIRIAGSGDIDVDGMSTLEAAAEIEHRLKSAELMLEPQVTVLVQEHASRQVSILGEVNHPGTYSLQGWPSLSSGLAAAGGVTPKEGSTIAITHRGDPGNPLIVRVTGTASDTSQAGILLRDSDVVTVSEAGQIYVVGDVTRPGEFFLRNGRPLTALEALAMAEGLKDNARPEKASIIRSHGRSAETIPVNLARVQRNEAPDLVLEPSDILVIPHSGYKQFQATVLPSLTGAAANALALALVNR